MGKLLVALAVASSLLITDAAIAQDASSGIWAARPRHKKIVEETVPASSLPGLAPGLRVQNSDGKAIGTVSQVLTASDGSIRKVIVMSPVGNLFKVSPTSLTVSNGVVITTEERSGS